MKELNYVIMFVFVYAFIFFHNTYSQNCQNTSVGFPPINDLGTGSFRGFQGGLYPNGINEIPAYHNNEGLNFANQIIPLDTAGNYDPNNGKIVLLSIGMSNTSGEFTDFMNLVSSSANINPKLIAVNGAQGGKDINKIVNPSDSFWIIINYRLAARGVNVKQVQAVWYKEAEAGPSDTAFPNYANSFKSKVKTTMNIMKNKFPNLKMCYLASRIYAGYAASNLNPEPYAYYTGWSVKWMIEEQINGDSNLVYKGINAKSPWLSWGPYLWADGTTPRIDSLTWVCPADYNSDGTHPSAAGRMKVASRLLNFFLKDETAKPWFTKSLTLNLTLAIEGFLNATSNTLNIRDTVRAYLRNTAAPYNVVDSSASVIDSVTLKGIFKFYNIISGNYYFQIKHRNSIETWSKSGGEALVFGGISNYDFTNSFTKAFGNNLVLKGTKYCIYSGDVNQDGTVDLSDGGMADNDVSNFNSGYISTDVNGDYSADISDLSIIDNNTSGYIVKITP